jgi:hypothetical protein
MKTSLAVVWHPEAIFFGPTQPCYWLVHPDMDTIGAIESFWACVISGPPSFAREIYLKTPYPRTNLATGFDYEIGPGIRRSLRADASISRCKARRFWCGRGMIPW